ncbi:MAG: dTMP kinase [Wolinella sp.]
MQIAHTQGNLYLALEGIDTCGKSTQIELLKRRFPQAIFTKEPGGSALGKELRNILLHGNITSKKAEFLLFLSDRAEHIERVIAPNLGNLIISDRSLISGIAYAKGFDDVWLRELNLFATGGILPNLAVILELSKEELERRLSNKKHDTIESRGVGYLMELQERIKEAARLLRIPSVVIDATKTPEAICERIIQRIKQA